MTLVKRNTDNFFPAVFDELLNTDWFGGVSNPTNTTPAVNVIEKDDAFEIAVAAPGFAKENFEISLDNNVLTIKAVTQDVDTEKTAKYARKEFNNSAFTRSFKLTNTIDNGSISGDYKAGILTVSLPKREEAKAQPKRLIEIA